MMRRIDPVLVGLIAVSLSLMSSSLWLAYDAGRRAGRADCPAVIEWCPVWLVDGAR